MCPRCDHRIHERADDECGCDPCTAGSTVRLGPCDVVHLLIDLGAWVSVISTTRNCLSVALQASTRSSASAVWVSSLPQLLCEHAGSFARTFGTVPRAENAFSDAWNRTPRGKTLANPRDVQNQCVDEIGRFRTFLLSIEDVDGLGGAGVPVVPKRSASVRAASKNAMCTTSLLSVRPPESQSRKMLLHVQRNTSFFSMKSTRSQSAKHCFTDYATYFSW